MALFSPRWKHSRRIEYSGCDQEVYQQDLVVHRTAGRDYEEVSGGLKVWHIYIGPKCRPNYGDLRFTDGNARELAYYLWPGYDVESARVCVRLEGADAAGTLTIHYGNAAATTTSNGGAAYLLFDHFDGAANAAPNPDLWEVVKKGSSSATVKLDGSGNLLLAGASNKISSGNAWAKPLLSRNVIIEYRDKISDMAYPHTSYGKGGVGAVFSNATTNWYHTGLFSAYALWVQSATATSGCRISMTSEEKLGATHLSEATSPFYPNLNTFYTHRFEIQDAALKFYRDGALICSASDTTYSGNDFRLLFSQGEYSSGAGGTRTIDYVLVRAYSATPPSLLRTSRGIIAPPIGAITIGGVPVDLEVLYDIEIGSTGKNLTLLYHLLRARDIAIPYHILQAQAIAAVYQIEVLKDLLTTYHILIKQEAVIPYDIPGGVTFQLVYSIDAEAVLDYQINIGSQVYGPESFWDLVITRKLNQVHTATFELWTEGSDTSQVREGEVLRIFYNDEVRFSGEIRSIEKDDMSGVWSIVCESGACRLADSAISGVLDYKSTPADQILRAVLPGAAWVGSIDAASAVDYRQEYADTLSHVVNVANVIGYDWRVRQQEDRYQVTSRTATTITVAGAGWPASSQGLAGRVVVVTSGKAKFRAGIIISHTTDTLTFAGSSWVSDGLAAGDMIRIFGPFRLDVQKRIGSPTPRKTFTVNETIFDSGTGRDIERVANSIVVPGTASITQDRRSIISGCTTLMTPITVTEAILRSNLSSSATEIPVDSTSSFPPSGTIQIEGERIAYTEKTLSSFTGCTRGAGGTQPAAHNLQTEVVLTSEMPVESTAGFPPSGTIWIGIEKIGYTSLSPTAFLTLTRGIDKTEIYSHRAGVLARCGLYTDENPEPGSSVALYGVRRRIVPALGVLDQNTLDILAQERLLAFQDLKVWGSATVPAPSFLEDIDVGDEIAIVPAGGGSPDEYRLVGIVWRQMTGEIEIEYGATREAFLEDLTRLEKGVELATARGAVAMLGTVLSVSENGEVAQVLLDDGTTVWARIR